MSYRCICNDCREEEVKDSWEAANAFFEDHAASGHDVEITRMEREETDSGDG